MKKHFLSECLKEEVFFKLKKIKGNYSKEWKKYPESVKKKILLDTAISFTYNTNAIEGSTITLDETEDLIKRKISPHKPLSDVQETVNHVNTFFSIINEKKKLSLEMLLDWHKMLFSQTKPDIAGILRNYGVRVGDYKAPDWQDVDQLMKDLLVWYEKKHTLMHPIEFAGRAHYIFEKIHPFGDGNGRLGRLLIAFILYQNGFPLIIIEYKNRKSYYSALQKDENGFLLYFIKRYIKQFKQYSA